MENKKHANLEISGVYSAEAMRLSCPYCQEYWDTIGYRSRRQLIDDIYGHFRECHPGKAVPDELLSAIPELPHKLIPC
jgi:hypothetical protein